MPGQKASTLAKVDYAVAESRRTLLEFQAASKYLDGVLEQIADEKRMAEAHKADIEARAERSVRKGDEARRAAEDRCTQAESRVR